jgi:asparagine synthase (glutamine-hydrolysing)
MQMIAGIWDIERAPAADLRAGELWTDAQGGVCALAGRIDNRAELARRLGMDAEVGAAAVVLAAYRAWGADDGAAALLGDFAFAIWDGARLICGRDQLGVKPLFYALRGGRFAFASSVRWLLRLPWVRREVDEVGVGLYLTPPLEPGDERHRTFYEDIVRLPDHHLLVVERSGERLTAARRSYWSFDREAETRLPDDRAYAEAFRALLDAAVRDRLVGWEAHEVGAALSGGMDSSSVVGVLRRQIDAPFHTFYMQPEVKEADESAYVEAALALGGTIHHIGRVPGLFDGGMALYEVMAMPTMWLNFPLSMALYRLAAEHGVKAFFDGIDGDTTISYGRRWLTELLARGAHARFIEEVTAFSAAGQSSARAAMRQYAFPHLDHLARSGRWGELAESIRWLAGAFGGSALGLALDWGRNFAAPSWLANGWRTLRLDKRLALQRWRQVNPMIAPDLARRVDLEGRLRASERPAPLTAREDHYRILNSGRLMLAFEDTEAIGAAFGIESLHPLSDRRVVTFCLGLPGDQRLRGGLSRWILRAALGDDLPQAIRERADKVNFFSAFVHALRACDLPFLDEVMGAPLEAARAYLDVKTVRRIYAAFRSGAALRTPLIIGLVRAARLAAWMRVK